MTTTKPGPSLSAERDAIIKRAHTFVLVRLVLDAILLALALLEPFDAGLFPTGWVLLADMAGLLLYRLLVRRWPAAATYFMLIITALLLIAADFSLGAFTLLPWFFTIPLGIAGGLIVTRTGFNSFTSLTLLAIFGVYAALIYLERIPLALDPSLPVDLFLSLITAIAVVVIMLNALVETLVVHLFQSQQDLVQAEVQLMQARTELEMSRNRSSDIQMQVRRRERLSAIGQITQQLSRSLGIPLAAIEALAADSPQALTDPDRVSELGQRASEIRRITDGLAHYASIGRSHIQTVNLDETLAEELQHIHVPDNVSLTVEQPPVFPPIQADPDHMRLMIHHLLDNALQAMAAEGGDITIQLTPAPEGIRFSVTDTGPGIPVEQRDIIFEPLYTTQERSFGLGLAICRQIVQMHGGRIRVESEVGQGTQFRVYLPRVPRHPPEEMAQDIAG